MIRDFKLYCIALARERLTCLSLWERCPEGAERALSVTPSACQLSQRESQVGL